MSSSLVRTLGVITLGGVTLGGLATPALARPGDAPPPGTIRSEILMRVSPDSRERPDRIDRPVREVAASARPEATRPSLGEVHRALPMRSEIQLRATQGDSREGAGAARPAQAVAAQHDPNVEAGRAPKHIALPIKSEILLRVSTDSREGNGPNAKAAAGRSQGATNNGGETAIQMKGPTAQVKQDVCRHTGICMPTGQGSSDVEDKAK